MPFTRIATHVLRHRTHGVPAEDGALAAALAGGAIDTILGWVPDAWLDGDAATTREAYARYFRERLALPRAFVEEAARAH